MTSRNLATFVLLALLLVFAGPARGQIPGVVASPTGEATPEPVPPELSSPRHTVATFLEAMLEASPLRPDLERKARSTLDLADMNPVTRNERGADLARRLYAVLQVLEVVAGSLPDEVAGDTVVVARSAEGEIVLARQEDGSWLFSRQSLAAVPQMYDRLLEAGRISSPSQDMPAMLRQSVAGLMAWQWLSLVLLALSGLVLARLVCTGLCRLGRAWLRRNEVPADDQMVVRVLRPVAWLVFSLLVMAGLPLMHLPETGLVVLLFVLRFTAAVSGVLIAYHGVDPVSLSFRKLVVQGDAQTDDMLVPLVRRTSKVVIVVFGVMFVAQNLSINVWSLFAGFSIVGAAVALAGQDTVKNLFGSITVLFDRPFRVGDMVKVGEVDGVVEDLGFRSTRIRTLYDSVVTVPNAQFLNSNVDNLGARRSRRFTATLGVLHSTPQPKLDAFCAGVRELVRQHPYTRKDEFYVCVNGLGASSIDILLYVFLACPDWGTELAERHRLILDILRLAADMGVEFAFPTSTVHLFQGQESQPLPDGLTGDLVAEEQELARQAACRIARATLPQGQ